jgi:hypothetical protein
MTGFRRSAPRILELTARLSDVNPDVWRRVRISSGATLTRAARVLATVMGWSPGRPYAFAAGELRYEGHGRRQATPPAAPEVRLRQLLPDAGAELEFEYGHGHAWHLMLRVERLLAPAEELRTPLVLAGGGTSPPVDVGGPWGYEEWRGEREGAGVRPRFDVEVVNARLALLR